MYYNIPGLRNSGQNHWQTIWEKKYPNNFVRIEQDNWEQPDCEKWINRLEETLSKTNMKEVILIGHSVGCATIVNWFGRFRHQIKGALLVAPSDVERGDYPNYISGFIPFYLEPLPFKTIVIASTNDHVVDFERAEYFADIWGSNFISIENGGHLERSINGDWEEGFNILKNF